ncbi:MAG TPA: flagellar basal body L-ring protein FlgH [Burkholderiales bacterium]|nr:flagellar basal body L-ring protein FlgH [Burkholderiales bacterium]
MSTTLRDAAVRATRWVVLATAVALIAGCANPLRKVEIQQPLTARPKMPAVPPANNGAIYQAAAYRPLFEDRLARMVGDTLTVNINEKLQASKQASSSANKTGSVNFEVPTVKGLPIKGLKDAALAADSKSDFAGKGDSSANNVFTGAITVTVIEVLPNGNLLVSGEKQLGINQGSEFIRLSGVVNPTTIIAGNSVSSTQIADARIEYRGTGYIDEAQTMGWMQRVFLSVLPF